MQVPSKEQGIRPRAERSAEGGRLVVEDRRHREGRGSLEERKEDTKLRSRC